MTTLSTIKKLSVIAAGATCLSLGVINPAHAVTRPNPKAIPTPALLPGLIGLGVGVLRKRKAAATAVETER